MKQLNQIIDKLKVLKNKKEFNNSNYKIPVLWLNNGENGHTVDVKPIDFFLSQIAVIQNIALNTIKPIFKNYSSNAIVYNMFVRLATAFDHNDNGKIDLPVNEMGFKETGTFLKAIALLPYLKSLGINTIYLLPITSIGIDENKGNLGSPYAIRNPYKIDEHLSEPILDLDIETQFKGFAECVHLLGMKLITEFVFRTASVDSDLAIDHPDWFYWIKTKVNIRSDKKNDKQYGPPIFTNKEIEQIKLKIEAGDFKHLPKPSDNHLNMFTPVPRKVARVENKIRGVIDSKNEVKIPGAFADWPPNDTQPVWSDVTYFKLYHHPKYNYIAYNTVRMYDTELKKDENKVADLWDFIEGIIPYYQNEFGIDGVMIDMGHALPSELRSAIVEKARLNKKDFIFWEENFSLTKKSVEDGYDAVLGYMPFDEHIPYKLKSLIQLIQMGKCPINFFATTESHNTPRATARFHDIDYSKLAYTFNAFLPTINFIHNGFELGETIPVNTGLDFKVEDYTKYPPEKLPLFSASQLSWNNEDEFTDYIKQINEIRARIIKDENSLLPNRIGSIETSHDSVIAFIRRDYSTQSEILICGNFHNDDIIECEIETNYGTTQFFDEIGNKQYDIYDGKLKIKLFPFECFAGKLKVEIKS